MLRKSLFVLCLILFTSVSVFGQEKSKWPDMINCTSIVVTKGASVDGSLMTTHSCDGGYDFLLDIIPGKKFDKGAKRPVLKGAGFGTETGRIPRIVGEIPQAEKTYTRFQVAYPFMNEKQLGIGETTIGGRRDLYNPEGFFDIIELEKVALERCTTAREAIKLMGSLATKYGYSDYGECLTLVDKKEAWFFEIFGPGPLDIGAVWAAQRIPDGHIGVSANQSRISTLDLKKSDYYMASENVYSLAEEMGWYDPDGKESFKFNKAYSPEKSLYCSRREWRVIKTMNPDMDVNPWDLEFPFSIKPAKKVSPQDLMALHRDSYQGTEFDMTKGLAAGPFGNPNRWAGNRGDVKEGYVGWERPIAIFRCAYAIVLQVRDWLPDPVGGLVWFLEDDPKTSCYMPMYCGMTEVPGSFKTGRLDEFNKKSAYWAFNFVSNWANLKYSYMKKDIEKEYTKQETDFFSKVAEVDKIAALLYKEDPKLAVKYVNDFSNSTAVQLVSDWWKLSDYLVAKYSDGYVKRKSVGYPMEWLEKVEFNKLKIKEPGKK